MKKQFLKVFAFIAAVLFVAQPAVASECDTREALFKAAAESGVKLNLEQTVTASSESITFAGSSIAGFEQIPATRLPRGVDAGFIYLNAPESGIPADFYRLHTQAPNPQKGVHEGTVSLVSRSGKVVAQLPATLETWSMEVPRPLPYERTLMEAQLHNEPASSEGAMAARPRLTIIIRCPNGTTIIIRIGW